MFSHDASQGGRDHRIRRVDLATGATTTLAGTGSAGFLDGAGAIARFYHPRGIAIEPSGGYALVGVRGSGLDSLCTPWTPRNLPSRRQRTCYRLHTVFPEIVPVTTLHAVFRLAQRALP